jgi:hypothetical protein
MVSAMFCLCFVPSPLDRLPILTPLHRRKEDTKFALKKTRWRLCVWLLRLPKEKFNKTSTTFHLKKKKWQKRASPLVEPKIQIRLPERKVTVRENKVTVKKRERKGGHVK